MVLVIGSGRGSGNDHGGGNVKSIGMNRKMIIIMLIRFVKGHLHNVICIWELDGWKSQVYSVALDAVLMEREQSDFWELGKGSGRSLRILSLEIITNGWLFGVLYFMKRYLKLHFDSNSNIFLLISNQKVLFIIIGIAKYTERIHE